jgi:hypothetical protein
MERRRSAEPFFMMPATLPAAAVLRKLLSADPKKRRASASKLRTTLKG